MVGVVTEADLWKFWRDRIVGHWDRVETVYPAGFPDVYGIYNNVAQFIELKVGPPRPTLLRPTQRVWLRDWWAAGGIAHIMVGDRMGVQFYKDLDLRHPVLVSFFQ
jgi:hypothetical protein